MVLFRRTTDISFFEYLYGADRFDGVDQGQLIENAIAPDGRYDHIYFMVLQYLLHESPVTDRALRRFNPNGVSQKKKRRTQRKVTSKT